MKVKIANIDKQSNSLNYIDSVSKKMLLKHNLTCGCDLVTSDQDKMVVQEAKSVIEEQVTTLTSHNSHVQECVRLLNFYKNIKYILIKEYLNKYKIYTINSFNGKISVNYLATFDRKWIVQQLHSKNFGRNCYATRRIKRNTITRQQQFN